MMASNDNNPSQPSGPIYSPPTEPRCGKTLGFAGVIIGGGLPCIWIIYVTLQMFQIAP